MDARITVTLYEGSTVVARRQVEEHQLGETKFEFRVRVAVAGANAIRDVLLPDGELIVTVSGSEPEPG